VNVGGSAGSASQQSAISVRDQRPRSASAISVRARQHKLRNLRLFFVDDFSCNSVLFPLLQERGQSDQGLDEDQPEAENVAGWDKCAICSTQVQYNGGQLTASHGLHPRSQRCPARPQSSIHNSHGPIRVQQNRCGREISMDNAAAMAATHRKGNVGDNFSDAVFTAKTELIIAL
jgi:hypothetical protein